MIKDFSVGECVSFKALCNKKEIKQKKNGESYVELSVTDPSGSIKVIAWQTSMVDEAVVAGKVAVFNDVSIRKYNGNVNAVAGAFISIADDNPMDYCITSKYSIESMREALCKILDTVEDEWCKKLIGAVLGDDEFVEKFCKHSAAASVHDNWVGGLLEHTLTVVRLSAAVGKIYKWLNSDLLVTAAFFHDIGKLEELSDFPENQYTDFGNYVGHVTGSMLMVDRLCMGINGFPVDVRMKLEHCILAHHGKLEFGSPKLPALPEAIVISKMDDLAAKLSIAENAITDGWTPYNKYAESVLHSGRFEYEE